MNDRNRNRTLWAMAALAVVYALVNVVVYFVSGTFGTGWFVASLVVYGLVLAGAILLLVADRPAPAKPDEPRIAVQVVNVQDERRAARGGDIVEVQPAPLVERGSTGDVRRADP